MRSWPPICSSPTRRAPPSVWRPCRAVPKSRRKPSAIWAEPRMAGRKQTGTGPLAPAASSLAGIPGVNTATAAKLAKLGLRSNEDLALHLPLRFEDETFITPVAAAPHGVSVQCEVTVLSSEVAFRPRRQLVAKARDGAGDLLVLRFLNFYPSQQKQLQPGAHLRVFGEIRNGFFGAEMVHPR